MEVINCCNTLTSELSVKVNTYHRSAIRHFAFRCTNIHGVLQGIIRVLYWRKEAKELKKLLFFHSLQILFFSQISLSQVRELSYRWSPHRSTGGKLSHMGTTTTNLLLTHSSQLQFYTHVSLKLVMCNRYRW